MNNSTRNLLTFCFIFFLALSCKSTKKEERKMSNDFLIINNADRKDKFSIIGNKLMKTESLGELKLNLGTKKIKELLGKPDEKGNPEIWGSDSEFHQDWKYNKKGIELNFVGEFDSTRFISRIKIFEPCELKTKKNIGIGCKYEDVQSAYRNEIDTSKSNINAIVAGTVLGGIIFEFESKKVKSIIIGAIAG